MVKNIDGNTFTRKKKNGEMASKVTSNTRKDMDTINEVKRVV